MSSKTRQALLHLSAGIVLLLPLIGSLASWSTFNEHVARRVVNSPSMWLISAIQGKAHEMVEWNRSHPIAWWERPAELVASLGLLGVVTATLLELIAWRLRRVRRAFVS
jgi:hypothetical protein